MADWLLILAPLLVLGVVLLVGFAGCSFEAGLPPVAPAPALSLALRVPATLSVDAPGVMFFHTSPSAIAGSETVSTPALDLGDNVFTAPLTPEAGTWTARCEVTVRDAGGQAADAASVDFSFNWDETLGNSVAAFRVDGSPSAPPVTIVVVGLQPAP